MLKITPTLALDEREVQYDFVHASGPGGQNVNKVASAVQLRFNVVLSPSLPEQVRQRLVKLAGKRVNSEGILMIAAQRYRTQTQNRRDALERLVALIGKAARRPKTRRRTEPTPAAKEKRIEAKKQRSQRKLLRKSLETDER